MNEVNTEDFYKWIDKFKITRIKKNIHRDFSDAVPLAEILKQSFPKLVDLHNYCSKNSFAQKLNNWVTLQRKVLSKLNINLSKNTLEALARAETGEIEKVLNQVKQVIESHKIKEEKTENEDILVFEGMCGAEDGAIVPIKIKCGNTLSESRILSAEKYDEMVKTLDEKERMIASLTSKVNHLEKLLKIKDERIDDLKVQLNKLDIYDNPTSRFLNEL